MATDFYTIRHRGQDSVSSPSSSFKLEHRQQLTIVPRVTRPIGPSHLLPLLNVAPICPEDTVDWGIGIVILTINLMDNGRVTLKFIDKVLWRCM